MEKRTIGNYIRFLSDKKRVDLRIRIIKLMKGRNNKDVLFEAAENEFVLTILR